jgi:hypothetical protein
VRRVLPVKSAVAAMMLSGSGRREARRPAKSFTCFRAGESIDRHAPLGQIEDVKRKTKRMPDMIDPKVLMAYDRWVAKHFDEHFHNFARNLG